MLDIIATIIDFLFECSKVIFSLFICLVTKIFKTNSLKKFCLWCSDKFYLS